MLGQRNNHWWEINKSDIILTIKQENATNLIEISVTNNNLYQKYQGKVTKYKPIIE